jgi:hypothetical protein
VGVGSARLAVSRPPAGRRRSRRSQIGPTRVRWSDGDRLQDMRRRLAATENQDTLRRIAVDVSELAMTAPENLLGDIGDVVDRAAEKIERLSPSKAPRIRSPKQRKPTAVAADEEEEPSLSVIKSDPLLERLIAVHGKSRIDIPSELAPRP